MGDDERPDSPSLEAPTLGRLFGRRKDRTSRDPSSEQPGPAAEPAAAEPAAAEPRDAEPVAPVAPAQVEETAVIEPVPTPAPVPVPAPALSEQPAYVEAPVARAAKQPKRPKAPTGPRAALTVSPRVAAAVTGLLIGLLVVVLTAGSLALCESVRGVSSCGGGPGFLLLVAVTATMVALGGLMLRLAGAPDPTSTSFLAVGLLCVVSLLFLIDVLDEWWMIIVIPIVSTVTFLLSHWVTTAVVEADA